MSTIFALATPPGRSGVAVVRVSGPASFSACRALVGDVPEPRRASLRWVHNCDGERVDQALIICFPGPESFTGEDSFEIQTHGSVGVIRDVLRILGSLKGLRPAQAGEFTRQALLNGRMTLTEVEGLGELLLAESTAQTQQALRLMTGTLKVLAHRWRAALLRARALLDAAIDFADEDLGGDITEPCGALVKEVLDDLRAEIDGIKVAERIREGFEVAILGTPNSGKSTLINRLARRDVALVSDIPGTTRDVLEATVEIAGQKIRVLDTAGLRDSDDPIEAAGVTRARQRSLTADVRLWLLEPGQDTPAEAGVEDLIYVGKSDISAEGQISGLTGDGLDNVLADIGERLTQFSENSGTATNARHRSCLKDAAYELDVFSSLWMAGNRTEEILCVHLNRAILSLDGLIGHVGTEEVLGEIFGAFCIGK